MKIMLRSEGETSDAASAASFRAKKLQWCSVSSLTIIEYSTTIKGSNQTARMRRLIGGFAGRTYLIVGNLMHWLMMCLGSI